MVSKYMLKVYLKSEFNVLVKLEYSATYRLQPNTSDCCRLPVVALHSSGTSAKKFAKQLYHKQVYM